MRCRHESLLPGLLLIGILLSPRLAMALRLDVRIEGLDGALLSNVLGLLDIHQERNDESLTTERLALLHRLAPEQIREALAPFGFYQVSIADQLEEPDDATSPWRATYRVTPGEPVKIGVVDYQIVGAGADNSAFPRAFPMQVGDVLLHSAYEKAKSELRDTASAQGYLDARLVQHQVLVDPVANNARIQFHLDTGPQYRIGQVSFSQDLLDETLLRRYVDFKPGVVYDPDLLLGLQGRLLGSEYYSAVEIVPRLDQASADHEVPVDVIATRNMPNKYRIGVGFATDVGPRLSMDWQRRYLNRWGHRLRTELSLSPALSSLALDYRIPLHDPTRDYLIIKPQSVYSDTATSKGWQHTLQIAHSTLTPDGWRRNLGLDYRYEDLDDGINSIGATSELVPNVSWSKTVSDDPINTSRGYRIKYTLLGAVAGLVSPTSYLSGQFQFKWIRRFAERYRFITRADLGATLAGSAGDLPVSRRFYAGGDQSIRGWGYGTLGPQDPNGVTIGGRYLAVGSLELERQIAGPWSVAVFSDFGNAFDLDDAQGIQQSVGFGLRWASPIGQVRCDLAFALTKDQEQDSSGLPPVRLHLVIGPDL